MNAPRAQLGPVSPGCAAETAVGKKMAVEGWDGKGNGAGTPNTGLGSAR